MRHTTSLNDSSSKRDLRLFLLRLIPFMLCKKISSKLNLTFLLHGVEGISVDARNCASIFLIWRDVSEKNGVILGVSVCCDY